MSDVDRIRWHCRRGMLELDLMLNAFLDRHLAALDAAQLDTFRAFLERPDPELLDLLLGHTEPAGVQERELIALLRTAPQDRVSTTDSLTR